MSRNALSGAGKAEMLLGRGFDTDRIRMDAECLRNMGAHGRNVRSHTGGLSDNGCIHIG